MNPLRKIAIGTYATALRVRLHVAYRIFGIEAINADLLSRTFGVSVVLKAFGAQVDASARVHGPLVLHNTFDRYRNLRIEANAHIGRGVLLDLTAPIHIGRDAVVAMQTTFLTHTDAGARGAADVVASTIATIVIEEAAYVGARALLLPGVRIGNYAVVGAGAVVTHSVADHDRVIGVPARSVKLGTADASDPHR